MKGFYGEMDLETTAAKEQGKWAGEREKVKGIATAFSTNPWGWKLRYSFREILPGPWNVAREDA